MSWIKLDDQWMDHPKIIRAGRDARDMWLASLTWCARHLTDGYFSENLLPNLAVMAGIDVANCQQIASRLVEVCLWERIGDAYYIHDYTDYNPTKEQAEAIKKARTAAGRAGGIAKSSKSASKSQANSEQNSAPSPSPSPSLKIEEGASPASPYSDDIQAESIFIRVTGMPTIPGKAEDKEAAIAAIRSIRYGKASDNEAVVYLQPYFREWKSRRYSAVNNAWLTDWAVSGEIPEPKNHPALPVKTRKLTDARGNIIEVPV